MELARRNNPDLVQLQAAWEVADAQAHTSEVWRDPELRVGAGRGDRTVDRTWWSAHPEGTPAALKDAPFQATRVPTTPVDESDRFQVALRFSPPNPLYASAREAANRALAEVARADFKAMEWRIYCELQAALAERDGVDQSLALADRLIETRRELVGATRRLLDAGELTIVDHIAAQQRVFQAAEQRERLMSRRRMAEDELRKRVGFTVPLEAEIERSVPKPLPSPETLDIVELEARALVRRSEIVSAQWRERAAAAALREARSTRMPWFSFLEASYGRTLTRDDAAGSMQLYTAEPGEVGDPVRFFSLDHETEEEWRIEAGVTLPVFSMGPRATRVALAGQRAARAEGKQVAGQVAGEVRSAFQDYCSQMRRIGEVRRDVQIQETQIRTNQMPSAGLTELSHFDEARLREAALDLESLIRDLDHSGRQAFLRLEAAVGGEL
jgi:outer membrane protein TolC